MFSKIFVAVLHALQVIASSFDKQVTSVFSFVAFLYWSATGKNLDIQATPRLSQSLYMCEKHSCNHMLHVCLYICTAYTQTHSCSCSIHSEAFKMSLTHSVSHYSFQAVEPTQPHLALACSTQAPALMLQHCTARLVKSLQRSGRILLSIFSSLTDFFDSVRGKFYGSWKKIVFWGKKLYWEKLSSTDGRPGWAWVSQTSLESVLRWGSGRAGCRGACVFVLKRL